MAADRIISFASPYDVWGPANMTPTGEYLIDSVPLPFGLLEGSKVEIRVNLVAWCTGLTLPLNPRVRLRLGGTGLQTEDNVLFTNEAAHGALVADFDVSTGYHAGPYWSAPGPEFGQNAAKRFGGIYIVDRPSGTEYVRMSTFADNTDRGCGLVSYRVDCRGRP